MSSEQAFIEARQESYYQAMNSGIIDNILNFMSAEVRYSDISWNVLDMDYGTFQGFVTHFYSSASSMKILSKAVSGTKDFVAWEWDLHFVPKEDNPAFGLSKGTLKKLTGISLVWWQKEGDEGGYNGWKVMKCKDFSCPAPAN